MKKDNLSRNNPIMGKKSEATFTQPLAKDTDVLNTIETVGNITMSETEKLLRTLSKYVGDRVMGGVIGKSASTVCRMRNEMGIMSPREMDERYETHKQRYNHEIPLDEVTHFMDFYRWSTDSMQRGKHGRKNYKLSDDSIVLLGMVYSKVTNKRYYQIYNDNKETSERAIQIIRSAMMEEEIKVLQMDRMLSKVIKECEALGITPIVRGKSVEHPYNSNAEQQFTNISKALYRIKPIWDSLEVEEANQLFLAMVQIHWEYNPTALIEFDRMINRIRLAIPQIQNDKTDREEN